MTKGRKTRLQEWAEDALARDEMSQLGHRIVYDTKTGWSLNIYGCYCNPSKLDERGYQVRP